MSGRAIPDPGHGGDAGGADPRLAAALRAYAEDAAAEPEVLAALTTARVLVPVTAVLTAEAPAAADALRREKATDMALLTLVGADGRRALPVFTSLENLGRWRADARPVPVDGRRAALAAAAEGAQALAVDVAGPAAYLLDGRPGLEALARGQLATPAYDDPTLTGYVSAVLRGWPAVVAAAVGPGAGVDARVEVALDAPATEDDVRRVVGALRRGPRPVLRGLDVALRVGDGLDPARTVYRRPS